MINKKKNSAASRDFLRTLRARPEKHILKKTNKEIEGLMGKISYLSNYTQLLISYQISHYNTKNKLSIEDNKKLDEEINMLIEEVNRLSLLAQIKNKTIETKMIKNYEYETESSCQ